MKVSNEEPITNDRSNAGIVAHLKTTFANPLTLLWLGGLAALIVLSLVPQAGLSEIDTGFGPDKLVRVLLFLLLSF